MSQSKSSKQWLRRHTKDPYVQRAAAEGWRSRAVYKLEEIQKKDGIIKPGMRIVDLGAAPGGWSQYAAYYLQGKGKVFALDILPMEPIEGVSFIQGDFREEVVLKQLENLLEGKPVDLVMSDMAPNLSGNKHIDQPRAMHLADLALDFALNYLSEEGAFLTKLFQGTESEAYLKNLRENFDKVQIRKPKASRDRSREVYVLAVRKRS